MNDGNSLKKRTFKNLVWRFLERVGAQLVGIIVYIILARLIAPEYYGTIALVTVITSILNVFIDSGLGNALIQKKDAGDLEFSTVFFMNIIFCLFLYVLLFFTAPLIARFYKDMQLTSVIRVLGLTLIFSGLKNIQQAYVSKKLLFKKFFFATLIGTIIAAIVGIYLAYIGFGVWALVAQQVINVAIDTFILWLIVPWRPKFMFSFSSFKELFDYGWKLLVASLINTFYLDLRQLIIGRLYSPSDLAFYNQGNKFPSLISSNINSSIDSVLFPVLSDRQTNIEEIKSMTRRSIKIAGYIMWPLLLGLAAVSKNAVTLVLTERWEPCIPYLIIGCFAAGFQPLQTANLNAIKAVGKSDIFLKLEIVKKSISTLIILISMHFGVFAIAIGSFIYVIIATICNSYPNRKILNYTYFEQLKDLSLSFFLSLIMALIVYFLPLDYFCIPVKLLIQIFVGVMFYVSMSAILKVDSYVYIKELMINSFRKN